MIDISKHINLIEKIFNFLNRKPKFKITLDYKSTMVIKIWLKNESSISHNITRIEGIGKGYEIRIFDSKYKPPFPLNPIEPEKLIELGVVSLGANPDPNLTIKIFSRWNGYEIEAGRLNILL
jgi:hypothetical protein